MMIDNKDVEFMESYVKEEDSLREKVIADSRIILKNSKSAIYSIHRKEYDEARKLTELSSKAIKDMESILKKHPHIKISAENALQEYV